MPRPFLYHCYHLPLYEKLAPFTASNVQVPRIDGTGVEMKSMYSLKKDMDELRKVGAAASIVDAAVLDVGTSSEGRKLHALKVGNGSTHKVLITGAHHSREWISLEVVYYAAEYLIQNYKAAPSNDKERRIKHLLDNRTIWFVPLVNPDGHMHTLMFQRGWRPNRREETITAATSAITAPQYDGSADRSIAVPPGKYRGIDVNRNYATAKWGQETKVADHMTTSRNPADGGPNSVWCGMAAGAEPETKAMQDLIATNSFRATIAYHSFSQLVLYPDAAAADAFVTGVANGMTALINEHPIKYTCKPSNSLYPTTGASDDFSYEKVANRPSYTVEVRPLSEQDGGAVSDQFSALPEAQIEPCYIENLGAMLALINCAGFDTLVAPAPVAPPSGSGNPVIQVVPNCWESFKGWVP